MENPEKVEARCEICQKDILGFSSWEEHTKTQEHLDNTVKFLMVDSGARTVEEIPEKIEGYVERMFKEIPEDIQEQNE